MPKAPMDKDDGAVFGENNVWRSRKASIIHFISKPLFPESMAQHQLRLRGCGMNMRHHIMSLVFSHSISHGKELLCKFNKLIDFAQKFIIFVFHANNHWIMKEEINRLKVILADKNKTSKWLAEQLGRDQATVSKWCTNRVQPSLETLKSISELLGVEIKDLLR